MRNRVLLTVLLLVALVAPAAPATATPATAERQLDWLIEVSHRVPVTEAEQREHLTDELLAAIGGPEGFNATLGQVGPLTLRELLATSPTAVEAVAGDLLISLSVNATGLVDSVQITPYLPAPTSWSELDSRLRTLAPRASFTASVLDGDDCRPVHQVGADTVTRSARPSSCTSSARSANTSPPAARPGTPNWPSATTGRACRAACCRTNRPAPGSRCGPMPIS